MYIKIKGKRNSNQESNNRRGQVPFDPPRALPCIHLPYACRLRFSEIAQVPADCEPPGATLANKVTLPLPIEPIDAGRSGARQDAHSFPERDDFLLLEDTVICRITFNGVSGLLYSREQ